MSNAFTNFLGGVVNGIFGDSPNLKDYQHADRLYVKNNYARTPKVGFLYFVVFNINRQAVKDATWLKNQTEVGILVKKIDLPKFDVTTEIVNQYNRKTVVQTSLKYQPISVDFHDDNSDITHNFWKNYFQYYYSDSINDRNVGGGKVKTSEIPAAFKDTKYNVATYDYGLNNYQKDPFLESIDVYVLHQQKFTQYTLINPLISNWTHDNVTQEDGAKILTNKMSLNYENVLYSTGKIVKNFEPNGFATIHYDTAPSPLSLGGNGTSTLFGPGGVIAGASAIFGEGGSLANAKTPLDYLGVAIQANQLGKNVKQLSKAGLKQEGYSILTGVLRDIQTTGNQPGAIGDAIRTASNQTGLGTLGNIGVNLFSNKNSRLNGTTQATPKNLTGGGP